MFKTAKIAKLHLIAPLRVASQSLGTLGGTISQAFGINVSGKVVGTSNVAGKASSHAFLYTPDKTSRGHKHGESNAAIRPRGDLSGTVTCPSTAPFRSVCATGVTSSQAPYIGEAWFTFNAPAPAGTHSFTATCTGCSSSATATLDVKVTGLELIPNSSVYTLTYADGTGIGATDNHKENHYLTPTAASVLFGIAASYQMSAEFWQVIQKRRGGKIDVPPLLHLNDASVEWGGLFDITGEWHPSHHEHRRGTVIDVVANANPGAVLPSHFTEFQKIALAFGGADAQIHCNKSDGQK